MASDARTRRLRGVQGEDLYALLGVEPDAPRDEIRAAYLALMRRYHPDHRPGDVAAAAVARKANVAWSVLGDAGTRADYDALRRLAAPQTPAPHLAADRSVGGGAVSREGADYRLAFHRACLKVGAVVVGVGALLLLALS